MDSIVYRPGFLLAIYIVIINMYGFLIMMVDKWKAERNRWRISERALFIVAFIGGAAGIYAGMKAFHHKTLHNKFRFGIPILLILNIVVVFFIYAKIKQ